MGEQIGWTHVPEITATVQAIDWSDTAYMYLEQIPTTLLDESAIRDGIQLKHYGHDTRFDDWKRGRIFDQHQELRWEWTGTCFHVVYCGSSLPTDLTTFPLAIVAEQTHSYYAWGKQIRREDRAMLGLAKEELTFVEAQIPRFLYYPVSDKAEQVCVHMKEFYTSDGQLGYARWCGLQEVSI
ncbi:MAG: hypothetical protein HC828_08025 [Blastochloris sp.]|nr:hypothetical protein [Blastochloris sp.]